MTPAARVAAAIEILDQVLAGQAAEAALLRWSRASRFAGAGDRAAIRDNVFDALRCRRSYAWLGGAETGRGLMLGALRAAGKDPLEVFTGVGHAPPAIDGDDPLGRDFADAPEGVRHDWPDWLQAEAKRSLGDRFSDVLDRLRHRAPVFLRANLARIGRDALQARLAEAGIETVPHPLAPSALQVQGKLRALHLLPEFQQGLVELQDAASQAIVEDLPLLDGQEVLDFCAGGGGKTLAIGARSRVALTAHDADPDRMRDLPVRAERAGLTISIRSTDELPDQPDFDLVLADAPCSGSGAWRRTPEAKWRLTSDRLAQLTQMQDQVLDQSAGHVRSGGWLAYATCSLFDVENGERVASFLGRNPGWTVTHARQLTPLDGGDGFYLAVLKRP